MHRYTSTLSIYINDLKYFYNLQILKESEDMLVCDLEVYINHFYQLREDIKIRFLDLDNMQVPERLIAPFDMKIFNYFYYFTTNVC